MIKARVVIGFIVSCFIFAALGHADEHRHASLPEYNLSVSFDIAASKILGKAIMSIPITKRGTGTKG
jgi:hypothetical protein